MSRCLPRIASLGWRAAGTGEQIIRLLLNVPLTLKRIRLVIDEAENARAQEFMLCWSPEDGRSYGDIVRQQYTFNPPFTSREVEDFNVDLSGVSALELKIISNISGVSTHASLTQLPLAS
ncbi:MAG TPA: hypothetical protein VKB96_12695 [Gammaproteobacteria bacterium]|nr:hypothetical protein [Gammaproteobacteria bacterium]